MRGRSGSRCALEKNVIFVTNNATKSRQSYKEKFDKLGVQAKVVRVCVVRMRQTPTGRDRMKFLVLHTLLVGDTLSFGPYYSNADFSGVSFFCGEVT
jgi:Haloacid dehalogenase-like hydrolase